MGKRLLFPAAPLTRSIKTVAAACPITWGMTALCMCVYDFFLKGTFERGSET
jgi:hypothetical protein